MFLTGTMLVGVGCKNYDDDINKLQDEVNNIKGDVVKLNSLEERVKAVEATAAEFKKIDFTQYVKNADLTTKLGQIQNEFNNKLAGYVTTGELNNAKTALENMIKDKTTLDEVKALLADYAKKADVYDKAKIDQLLADQFNKITSSTNTWLGPQLDAYMAKYITSAEFKGAASAAILEKLNAANAEYVAALNKALDSIEGDEAIIREKDLKVLKDAMAEYLIEIEDLWAAVGQLASRIQSLVFVPEYTDGGIMFGTPYIGSGDNKIVLTETLLTEATFRVSPASLVEGLVKGYNDGTIAMEILDEELTRALNIEIVSVSADTKEAGKINLTLTTDYGFANELAVALNIADVPAEDDDMQGIEFCSSYVPCTLFDDTDMDVTKNLVVAEMEDGEYIPFITNEYELAYNAPSSIALDLLEGFEVVYKVGDNDYVSLADAAEMFDWEVIPVMKTTTIEFTNFTTKANYKITPANPEAVADENKPVTVAIAAGKTGTIGQFCTLTTWFSVTDPAGTKNVAIVIDDAAAQDAKYDAITTVKIVREILSEINADAAINWNYTEYAKADNEYNVTTAALSDITTELFNKLNWAGGAWKVVDPAGAETKLISKGAITVTAVAGSTPTDASDAKKIKYTVKNYLNGNGSVKISGTVPTQDGKMQIKVSGTITFAGLADMAYTVATRADGKFDINNNNVKMVLSPMCNEEMFNNLGAGQQYFANQADFDKFLATLTEVNVIQEAVSEENIPYALLDLSGSTMSVAFRKANIDFSKFNSYTYTVPKDAALTLTAAGFKIALTGGVTIDKKAVYYLKKNPSGLFEEAGTDGYMLAIASVKPTGTDALNRAATFEMSKVELKNGYTAQVPEGVTATVTYAMNLAPTTWPNAAGWPTLAQNTGIIDWNGSGTDKVEVTYTMKVGTVVMDTKKIEVRVQKMLNPEAWKALYTTTATVQADVQGVDNKLYVNALMKKITDTQSTPNKLFFVPSTGTDEVKDAGTKQYDWTKVGASPETYGLTIELGKPVYSDGNERFNFDPATGVFTVAGRADALATDVTVTIPVTYTYQYAWSPVYGNSADPTEITTYEKTKFTANLTFKVVKSKVATSNKR